MRTAQTQIEVSLLLLNYNKGRLARIRGNEFITHLANHADLEIIFIDNGSEPQHRQVVQSTSHDVNKNISGTAITYILPQNVGFGRAFNAAAKQANGNILIFYSNDVRLGGDILGDGFRALVKPKTLVCHTKIGFDSGWNRFGNQVIPYGAGYFLACTKEFWHELGGFDSRFHPYDYEDVDLSMSAANLGGTIMVYATKQLYHEGAGTIGFNPTRYENTVTQRARFAEKWSLPNEPTRP